MMEKACVIGWPIKHSRSPLIHNFWLQQYEISGVYEKQAVSPQDFENYLINLSSHGYIGCNITIPHKESCFNLVEVTDPFTKQVGAVNTVYYDDGILKGFNTDGIGYISNLKSQTSDWSSIGKTAFIIGAGGAARAILVALLNDGIETIRIFNRTLSKAVGLAEEFGNKVYANSLDSLEKFISETDLLVNTSSLGMVGQNPLTLDLAGMKKTAVVSDIVYTPLETELLKQAKRLKLQAVTGLGMLLYQAVPGFEKWFGQKPIVTKDLYDLVVADIEEERT